ncbi:MAG: OmpP1/FadL family transporter [Burkholderiales bacterium]
MKLQCLAALALGAFTANASASGFALLEQNSDGMGSAYAGGAASAEDASTVYYNPAGLTQLDGDQWAASLQFVNPSLPFSDRNSTSAGKPLSGGNGGNAGAQAWLPSFFLSHGLNERTTFGLGVSVPFGLETDYESGWKGRYYALNTRLQTLNFNPSLAYKINASWSIGGGVDLQYAKADLSSAVDFGLICVGLLRPGACAPSATLPQQADGLSKLTGDSWAWGYNLGVLYSPSRATRFGMAYRSHIDHTLEGDVRFTLPANLPAPLAASPRFANTAATADLRLPDSFSMSVFHQASERLALMADFTWTGWSRFDELRIRFANGSPDNVTQEHWHDTQRISLGALYRYDDTWSYRAGIASDQSPVPDQYRTANIPDNDRIWLTVGTQYRVSKRSRWDFGYAYVFVKGSDINLTSPSQGNLVGNYQSHFDVLSAQYSQAFR